MPIHPVSRPKESVDTSLKHSLSPAGHASCALEEHKSQVKASFSKDTVSRYIQFLQPLHCISDHDIMTGDEEKM